MATGALTVLVVDDSPVVRTVLKRLLEADPGIHVVGVAADGREGLARVAELKPQVICTDLHMPVMNGLEFTQHVMDQQPTPILCISTSVREEDRDNVFRLLEAGAVDVFPKPEGGLNALGAGQQAELIRRVKVLAGVRVFRRRLKNGSAGVARPSETTITATGADPGIPPLKLVILGSSTGGPQVLKEILGALPANFPLPILCVQHISLGFLTGLVRWLDDQTPLTVKVVRPGELPRPGTVYFPQENTHLEVHANGCLMSSRKAPINGLRPAVDVTFTSVAEHYGSLAAGVLLTGMGDDGAAGLAAMARAGALTIAQDEASSTVFGMPRRAIELGAAQHVLAPAAIVRKLKTLRYEAGAVN